MQTSQQVTQMTELTWYANSKAVDQLKILIKFIT